MLRDRLSRPVTAVAGRQPLPFVRDDGGRAAAGFRGHARDCTCRAIAIAMQRPYREVYDELTRRAKSARRRRNGRTHGSARTGVSTAIINAYFADAGWIFVPTMTIGSGCRVHLAAGELPAGRLVARVSGHLAAVIDGTLHDTYDSGRGGTRCVYGYWCAPASVPI